MLNSADSSRFHHIDAMRAVAVLFVIWTHYAERFAPLAGSQIFLDTLQRSVNFGRVGVVIFFAISGMLIPTSLRGEIGEGTRRFLIRRFFRLYPAYWLTLPLGYLIYCHLFNRQMNIVELIANVTMIPTAFGQTLIMPHAWTLETELYFYGLCLLLFWCGALHRMRDLYFVCAALCGVFVVTLGLRLMPADTLGQYKAMPFHLAIMFWGACFRQAYDRPFQTLRIRWASHPRAHLSLTYRSAMATLTVLIVSIAIAGAINDWLHHNMEHLPSSLAYVIGIALFALLATVLKLRVRLFSWLGEISYSIYLLHGIPLYATLWLCERFQFVGWPLGLYMIVAIMPLIPLSWAGYRFCEAPCVRLAHRFTENRRDRASVPGKVRG